jgi:hypothetical protein
VILKGREGVNKYMAQSKTPLIIAVVLIPVALIGGFFAGMQYQKMQRSAFARSGNFGYMIQGGQGGQAGGMMRNGGMRPTTGQIVSSDDKSVTVKLTDGSSKIVILSSSTSINKAATGTAADLKQGETIAVFGTTNSDGSVTAQSIQLNPQMRIRPSGTPTGVAQ